MSKYSHANFFKFPLPKTTADLVKDDVVENLGLYFQKFVSYPDQNDWSFEENKHNFLKRFASLAQNQNRLLSYKWLLENYKNRQKAFLKSLAKRGIAHKCITFEVSWRLCIGLGSGSVLEGSGMSFHPILGLPYLPASSLKGIFASYLKLDKNIDENSPEYREIFGGPAIDEQNPACRGKVEFLDALPTQVPKFDVDILNCHYPKYYQENQPPGDWQSPKPVYFLTVAKGTKFKTALISEKKEKLDQWVKDFKEAVGVLGVGAKTRVGYGEVQIT